MKLQHSEHTDVGRVRQVNQDSLGMKEFPHTNSAIYVVADGMGGYQAGEVASQAAVETILETFHLDETSDIAHDLKESFSQANQAIVRISEGRTMGTTGVALVLYRNLAFLANVGDSRAYVIRNGDLRQITLDHSLVEEQVRAGLLTKEQARVSTIKNIVTRALGHESDFRADVFCEPVQVNDIFLLCSDGLHGYVEEEVILETIKTKPFETVTKRLIDLANEAGGPDNITAIVVRVLELDDIPANDPLLQALLARSKSQIIDSAAGPTGTAPLPVTAEESQQPTTVPISAATSTTDMPREEPAPPTKEKSLTLWGCLGALFVIAALAGVLYWFELPPMSLLFAETTPTTVVATPTMISVPTTTLEPATTATSILDTLAGTPTSILSPTEVLEPSPTP